MKNDNAVIEKEKEKIDDELQQLEVAKKWLADLSNFPSSNQASKRKIAELDEKFKAAKEVSEKSLIALEIAKAEQKKQEPIFKKIKRIRY